jgi:hypothetical protein
MRVEFVATENKYTTKTKEARGRGGCTQRHETWSLELHIKNSDPNR